MPGRWGRGQGNTVAHRKQRLRVLARDGYACQVALAGCTGKATQAHHLVPWTPGVPVPDHQVVASCAHCNASLGAPEKWNPDVPRPDWL